MDETEFAGAISPWLPGNDGPLRANLTLAISQAISSGQLATGLRLPPERALAKELNVSRPTVSAVIEELRDRGLVTSRQGSGTWISSAEDRGGPQIPFVEMLQATGRIDLAAATAPDAGSLPQMRVETADLLMAEPANGLNLMGLWPLRESVAERAAIYIPDIVPENVMITSGAHQALALVVAALAPRGSTVLVEETTYGGLVDMIRAAGCHPLGVRRDSDGIRPDELRDLVHRHRPSLTILVSPVHSPTGTVSSSQRSAEIADVLIDAPTQVVLDETYADLEFAHSGRPLSVRFGLRAIRVGSLSKTLWTGLRTGWVIGPAATCTEIARRRWQQFDLGPSVASQLFALQAMEGIEALIVNRRSDLREKSRWAIKAFAEGFPAWNPSRVDGGLAMWVGIPRDGSEFATAAAANGVAVLPGWACRADNEPTPHIRICFDRPIDVLEAAIERMSGSLT